MTKLGLIGRDLVKNKNKNNESEFFNSEKLLGLDANLLRNILNNSKDYIFVKDKQLRTIMCNEYFAQALGKKQEELYGRTDIENGWSPELVKGNPEKGIRGFETDDREALKGITVHNPSEPANVNGEIRYFDTTKTPFYDDIGNIIGVLGIASDITKHKQNEGELKKLSRTVESSSSAVIITDLAGTIEYVNQEFTNSTGYMLDEVIGLNPKILKSDETPVETYTEMWDTISAGGEWISEIKNRNKDGSDNWVRASIVGYKDPVSNKITHYIGIHDDLNKIKQMEWALIESENKFRNLVENSLQAIFIHRHFKPLFANQRCATIFGYDNPGELLKLDSLLEAFCLEEEKGRLQDDNDCRMREEEAPAFYDSQYKRKDGSQFFSESHVTMINWHGELASQVTIIDVNESKMLEKQFAELQNMEILIKVIGDVTRDKQEGVALGVFAIDRDRNILSSNKIALEICEDNKDCFNIKTQFYCRQHDIRMWLEKNIKSLIDDGIESSKSVSPKIISVKRASSQIPLLMMISSERRKFLREDQNQYNDTLIIFLYEPTRETTVPTEISKDLYDLSSTEAKVLHFFVNGLKVNELATKFCVSVATIRKHLHNIFEKTNTTNQAELMRLVISSSFLIKAIRSVHSK